MKKRDYPLQTYELIEKAVAGDIEAMNQIVRAYRHYMLYFCKKNWVYDEDLMKQVEVQLIYAILRFEIR